MTNHKGNIVIDFSGEASIMTRFLCCGFWHVEGGGVYIRNYEKSLAEVSLDGTFCEVLSVCSCQRGLHDLETQQSGSERVLVSQQSNWASVIYSDIIVSQQEHDSSSALLWTNTANFYFVIIHLRVNRCSTCSDMKNKQMSVVLFDFGGVAGTMQRRGLVVKEPYVSSSVFRLFVGGEDTCTLDPLQLHTLTSCGFNSSNPLIIITHGWSVRSTPAPLTLHWPELLHTKHGAWQ